MIHRRRFLKSLVGLAAIPFAPLAALAPKFATGGIVRPGAYVVGSSNTCFLQYNRGPVPWLQSHCIVYMNARNQMIEVPLEGGNWS